MLGCATARDVNFFIHSRSSATFGRAGRRLGTNNIICQVLFECLDNVSGLELTMKRYLIASVSLHHLVRRDSYIKDATRINGGSFHSRETCVSKVLTAMPLPRHGDKRQLKFCHLAYKGFT